MDTLRNSVLWHNRQKEPTWWGGAPGHPHLVTLFLSIAPQKPPISMSSAFT